MRFRLLLLLSLTASLAVHAQTFTPQAIEITGVPDGDRLDVITITGLHPGPMSKEVIETALGKLADAGDYTDISYTVDPHVLTIKLTPAPGHGPLPIRFTNFDWWTDAELEAQVESRVPAFHGKAKSDSSLAEQVKKALVSLAAEKGITVTVDAEKSGQTLSLTITKPPIMTGTLTIPDVTPIEGETTEAFRQGFADREFIRQEAVDTINYDTTNIYANAGYLHAVVSPPQFAMPRLDDSRYVVDASVTVEAGALYRVGTVDVIGADSKQIHDFARYMKVHAGDPASPLRHSLTATGLAYGMTEAGYLDATVAGTRDEDPASHTVDDSFEIAPGTLYHLARISVDGTLPPELVQALQKDKRLASGVVADETVRRAANEILRNQNALRIANFKLVPNHDDHTASLVVHATAQTTIQ